MTLFKRIISIVSVLCLAVLLPSCSGTGTGSGSDSDDAEYSVVTSFYPIYIFTLNLTHGIDGISVSNMTEQNVGCLHDYRLLTRDVKLLSDADLLVLCGAGMESFLGDLLAQLPDLKTADSSVGIKMLYIEENVSSHMQAANSHIWLSVKNAEGQVNNICDALKSLCPEYSAELEKNRKDYIKRLRELDAEITDYCSDLKGIPIITFHEAYDYMARDLSFDVVASIESDEGGEPSAKELGELTEIIKNKRVKALFVQQDYAGSAAQILSDETQIPVLVLNTITGGNGSLTSYEDLMRENVRTIAEIYG